VQGVVEDGLEGGKKCVYIHDVLTHRAAYIPGRQCWFLY
jgi:hypothetical protein